MIVMKFGGTSVGSAERLAQVANLVDAHPGPVGVVVSALGGATDALLVMGDQAEQGEIGRALSGIEALRERHREAAPDPVTFGEIEPMFEDLHRLIHGVGLLREQTPRSRAMLGSFGERLCAPLAAGWLRRRGRAAVAVDARDLLVTDEHHEAASVLMDLSRVRTREVLLPLVAGGRIPVITGFVGATEDGVTTVLGRGGSDLSASLMGAFLDAEEIWIWTDVDGILSADPRIVRDARSIPAVSYREAAEMSYFGAKVVHPKTMMPARALGIPIVIRSTFQPDRPGTRISEQTSAALHGVKTVTAVRQQALITIEGPGMAGVPGIARRIFGASAAAAVNVVMISQASSEQTVSAVIGAGDVPRLKRELEREFELELRAGLLSPIQVGADTAVLSVIGEGMAGSPGVSARLFGALGKTGVNVRAIAQGGSELSISVAIRDQDAGRAVRAAHAAFGLRRTLDLVVFGVGRVGRALLEMLEATREELARTRSTQLRLLGVAGSSGGCVDPLGIPPERAIVRLRSDPARLSLEEMLDAVDRDRSGDVCVVDLTAADTLDLHLQAMARGFHVVTANKLPISGSLLAWHALVEAVRRTGAVYGFETTFGAGLPVLHTLQELLSTGDRVHSVSGCFSGTLGFLCTRLQSGAALSDAVGEAVALGYTEPDPREDLSGRDVGRKALIIARAMGMEIEASDVTVEPFVHDLESGLQAALAQHQGALAERVQAARFRDQVLRYVAEIVPGRVRVALIEVSADSAIGSLRGPDNILVFRTQRYQDYPLVIRGPGAGAEVTAAGVLGDIIRVAMGT